MSSILEPEINSSPVTPKCSPIAPVPTKDPLTPAQWKTFMALADAVIPSIKPASRAKPALEMAVPDAEYEGILSRLQRTCLRGDNPELAVQYLEERPSQNPDFRNIMRRVLSMYLASDALDQILQALNLLDSRFGGLLLNGGPFTFASYDITARQKIIKSWATSRIPLLRLLNKSLCGLVKQQWARTSSNLGQVLSFPRVPVHGKPGNSFEYEFLQLPPGNDVEVIETDIIIVGSGCGGAVCAKNLAQAGYRVIVADKAYHWPAEHLPMTEEEGFHHMFLDGGASFAEDNSMILAAGQAWGGGGTVNWSASLQTQGFVREEWSKAGLPFFTSAEFQSCLDKVFHRMGASTEHIVHNKGNAVLMEGARKLGWAHKAVPQNTGGKQHYCGYCTLGCGSCEKQGPVVSFLPDAAKAGAKFIEGFNVEKVIFDKELRNGQKVATGVEGVWTSRDEHAGVAGTPLITRRLQIRAKRVVISASTMQSPLVLKRSGLKNKHIGKHLKTHPVSFLGAIYEEEVKPWEGGILTSVITEFENQDGKGHGSKLEAVTMLPSIWLTSPPWTGGVDYKVDFAPMMKHMVGHFAIQRDISEGEVFADPKDGRTRYRYVVGKTDREHMMNGLVALAKINYVAGAREIFVSLPGVSRFVRKPNSTIADQENYDTAGINCPSFQAWLQELRRVGFRDPDCTFLTAHQMGTCRMAASEKNGVVDPKGRVFGTEGLLVADASVFPSASGVNPMVTNMAIAEWISGNLAKDLRSPVEHYSRL